MSGWDEIFGTVLEILEPKVEILMKCCVSSVKFPFLIARQTDRFWKNWIEGTIL